MEKTIVCSRSRNNINGNAENEYFLSHRDSEIEFTESTPRSTGLHPFNFDKFQQRPVAATSY